VFCAAPRRRANKTGEQIGPAAWLIRIRTATARAEMAPQQQQPQRPNVLILLSDQHSKMQLGCAGDEVVRTPALDRLAAEGMLFTNCYTPAPVCVPARMSFMSTLTPSRNEVWGNNTALIRPFRHGRTALAPQATPQH
jgi:arylsulfatase A-like enzyme